MCTTCGCSNMEGVIITDPASGAMRILTKAERDHMHAEGHPGHPHAHTAIYAPAHTHPHTHEAVVEAIPAALHGTTIALEQEILSKNRRIAERNRGWLSSRGVLALNLVSSPGSGKTSLLERTLRDLRGRVTMSVIEGDQETMNDAERIRATGCKAIQINTGKGCHLEAEIVGEALAALDAPADSVVMIENVGNLVCPALFDLGERAKIVILSVTEGDDKPLKYPHMFHASELMLINKMDLLPYVDFDVERCIANARQVNPNIQALRVSATTGAGMEDWYHWLQDLLHSSQMGRLVHSAV
ncbi:MAG: hydrogenase nickel incorporation protein HypB [Gammaproteobacteria bacterium]|nr:hydrogenase nickel incorporation protein HypB [Gammaproteobacteria bacterium]